MSGEVANYVIVGLVSIIAVYLLLHNRDRIRLFFASASQRLILVEQAKITRQKNKEGMDDYERQAIIDILKDQLEYSRKDLSSLQRAVEAVTKELSELKTAQIVTSNRLEGYRILLSRIEENTRR